jgi:ribosomal protein L17
MREARKTVHSRTAVQKLFEDIGPRFAGGTVVTRGS